MSKDKPEPKVDSTLSKGLSILENLSASSSGKGVTKLSNELGLTKSNTFRLLRTLTTLGYVKHSSDKSYSATLKTWQIGRGTIENLNLREIAAPEMHLLSEQTGEAIYLAIREDLSVIYINKVDSLKPIRSWNPIGGNAPIHCVGTGKALLAANYTELRDKVKTQLTGFTDKTLTSIKALDADIKLTLERGYAYDCGEFRERILSVGATIELPDREVIAAFGISLPDINLPEGGEVSLGKLVAGAAESVSQKLRKL